MMRSSEHRFRASARVERAVCAAAALAAVALHAVFLASAGGLWRDEASLVRLATFETIGETWRMLGHESFPALFPAAVRGWSALGLAGSDHGLRCLGFLVGLALLGSLWLSAHAYGRALPFVSLALLAANATVIRWGGSLRGYGLGAALMVLTAALVWRAVSAPSPRRAAAAAIMGIASVQCLYQNAFLLAAVCCAGLAVCARRGRRGAALGVLAIGAAAALSLLPYAGIVAASREWWIVEKRGFDAEVAFYNLYRALGSPMKWQALAWIGLGSAALARGLASFRKRGPGEEARSGDLPLFSTLSLALGTIAFVLFLVSAKLPTQPWYWLPLMPFAASCIDAALAETLERRRIPRIVFVAAMVAVPFVPALKSAAARQTNMDLLAARVAEEAKPGDFVVVYPWYYGVAFDRYYTGEAPWETLPPLEDSRIHRYDLLKEQLAADNPIDPVLERVGEALATGGRVWIVGGLPPPRAGETAPSDLPPAPGGEHGWSDVPYNFLWGRTFERFITARASSVEMIPPASGLRVSPYERASLSLALP
jgi:hypothetical protein